MTSPIKKIEIHQISGYLPCLEAGPEGYHCTERRSHEGKPHVASVVRLNHIATEIVRWGAGGETVWNKDYKGR